ncbi:MAG TPA: M56 family metallopeptidase [Vicinamibacterales bacterium]|nr:M56 family metallopeptidase [Vicinamibacterales bacterium]
MTAAFDLVIRSLVMLAGAGAVAWMLRRRGAAVQSLVMTTALAALLALPVAAAMLPAWPVPVWSVPAEAPSTAGVAFQPIDAPAPSAPARRHRSDSPATTVIDSAVIVSAPSPGPAASPAPFVWPTLVSMLAGIWAAGVALLVIRLVSAHLALAKLVHEGDAGVDPGWQALVRDVSAELGVTRPVAVKSSAELSVPIVTGLRKVTLLIPEESHEWPPSVRRDVVRHELAHVARWDVVGQLVGQLACALHWFNPLVWIAARRASTLRERACDDVVLRAGAKASAYAACLLDLAANGGRDRAGSAALAMARASRIRERIVGVLDPGARRETPGPIATAVIVAAALAGVAAAGSLEPTVRAEAAGDIVAAEASRPFVPLRGLSSSTSTAASLPVASAETVERASQRPTASQATTPAPRFCSGEIKRHSNSSNDNGRERSWKLRIEGTDCDLRIDARGRVEFNDAFTDIARLDRDGSFFIEVLERGVRKSLDIRSAAAGLTRTYRVDGRDQAWDAAAQAWFADLLIEVDRLTAVGVDHRFPRLFQQGGVQAVLAETALMPSDYARSRYYEKLLDAARLTPAERRAVVEQSARMTKSDYYATELLKRVVAQGRLEDPQERAAVIDMIERMKSDYYRHVVINELGGTLSSDQLTALLKVAAAIDSDYYRSEVLKRLLTSGTLTSEQQAIALGALGGMDSDYYITEVLKLLSSKQIEGPDARKAFLAAAYRIDSGFYKQEALSAFVRRSDLTETDLLAVVDASRGVGDYYRSEVLVDVLRSRAVTDRVREVVRDAAQGLSSSYRQRVYGAIGR